ncbi:hypothetical protein CcCBS67573_g00323 [Chytriomyces confervae]|uniref:RING-type E3 ubiquitin transferase n=1 Tax=Chytriomyces confervae TaxID=246404 RepID=A0A507FPQ7_9FUNG|nr:hypothetical protein CcCBS67573_g00323 [Chytriomyces confervae]
MNEGDEEVCRVCRGPGTDINRLFHPCKCSGSMKYVHQECLEEWLSHSRKKHCEICSHKYAFAPLYVNDTPPSISYWLFMSVIGRRIAAQIRLYLRVLLAICVWLITLPLASLWIWRFWFDPMRVFGGLNHPGGNDDVMDSSHSEIVSSEFNNASYFRVLNASDAFSRGNGKLHPLAPFLNFTIGYLVTVADSMGINGTLFHELQGRFPLRIQDIPLAYTYSVSESAAATTATAAATATTAAAAATTATEQVFNSTAAKVIATAVVENDFAAPIDWMKTLKSFFLDVFEGQIILSVLIIIATTLLCIKEYVVLNTPVDGNGNPVNPPEDAADENGAVRNAPPPPPPPVQRPRPRPNPPRPLPQAAHQAGILRQRGRQAPVHEHARGEAAQPRRQADDAHPGMEASALEALQSHHELQFTQALRNPACTREDLSRLFETSFQAAETAEEKRAVAAAADAAVAKLRLRDEQEREHERHALRQVRHEAVESVRRAVEDIPGLPENAVRDVLEAFEADVEGLSSRAVRQAGLDTVRDFKALKRRRSAGMTETSAVEGRVLRSGRIVRAAPIVRMDESDSDESDLESKHEEDVEHENEEYINPVYSRQYVAPQAARPTLAPVSIAPAVHSASEVFAPASSSSQPFIFSAGGEGASAQKNAYESIRKPKPIENPVFGVGSTSTDAGPVLESRESVVAGKRKAALDEDEWEQEDDPESTRSPLMFGNRMSRSFRSKTHDLNANGAVDSPHLAQRRRTSTDENIERDELDLLLQSLNDAQDDAPEDEPLLPEDLEQHFPFRAERPAAPIPARPERPLPPPALNNNNNLLVDRLPPIAQAAPGFNDAFNLNVNLEVGPDGIAAEVQAQGDINAFMELVGIQGPLDMLLQNFAIATFVVFAAIGGGLWLPSVFGRLILWLLCDVYYPLVERLLARVVVLSEAVMDPVLDPVVDGLVEILKWTGLLALAGSRNGTDFVASGAVLANVTVNPAVESSATTSEKILSPALEDIVESIKNATVEQSASPELDSIKVPVTDGNDTVVSGGDTPPLDSVDLEDDDPPHRFDFVSDRVANAIAGYIAILFVVYHHARRTGRLRHPYVKTFKRMCYKGARFLCLSWKFTFFITIELGMFPTFCGLLMDMCTLTIFGPEATIDNRIAFYNAYPWSSYFLHWLAGTTFMFQFAAYVQSVRKIVRPGVVWFIRDPEDPQFHPMQDILEKPILSQLRKLAFGAIMYAIVVVSTVGGFVGLVQGLQWALGATNGAAKFFPLKWEFSEPLSEFPIDLLIFHFLVPAAVSWIRPRDLIVEGLRVYFRATARILRITQFLLGERRQDEEHGEVGENDPLVLKLYHDGPAAEHAPDEQDEVDEEVQPLAPGARETPYLRVPNHDRIPLKPGHKVMIPMTRTEPLVGREDESEDDIKLNWTRVYVPSHLRIRLLLLMVFQWMAGLVCAVFVTIGPLYLGRIFFIQVHEYLTDPLTAPGAPKADLIDLGVPVTEPSKLVSSHRRRFQLVPYSASESSRQDLAVHDVFAYTFGLLLCIGFASIVLLVRSGVVAGREFLKNRLGNDVNTGLFGKLRTLVTHAGRWGIETGVLYASIAAKVAFVFFWVAVAIPLLLGLLFEVYIVDAFTGDKSQTRVLFLLQDWALGAIYTKIIHSIVMNSPETEFRRILVAIRQGGFQQLEIRALSLQVLFPIVLVSTVLLFLPGGVNLFSDYLHGDEGGDLDWKELAGRMILPGILALVIGFEFTRMARKLLSEWMEEVRDEHFLVGRRLKNLGELAIPNSTAAPASNVGVVADEVLPLLDAALPDDDENDWVDQDV